MRPRTRNGLAVLVLLLLIGGIVAALVHDHDGTKSTSTATAQPATTAPPTTSATSPSGPATSVTPTTLDQTSPRATTPTTVAGSTATTAMTRQPRTGGPSTLPVGLLLVAAGLVALRFHAAAVRAMGDLQAAPVGWTPRRSPSAGRTRPGRARGPWRWPGGC
jgi:hypothetical protein